MLFSVSSLPLLALGTLAAPAVTHKPGKQQALLSSGAQYQADVVWHHNAARSNFPGVGPLVWSQTAANNALIAAKKCVWAHYIPANVNEGQNIFATTGSQPNVTSAITEAWYKSEFPLMKGQYGKPTPSNPDAVGHLTQLVWKGTQKVGCVSYHCGTKMKVAGTTYPWFTVCNYYPPGNYLGEFDTNVPAPKSNTSLGHWSD